MKKFFISALAASLLVLSLPTEAKPAYPGIMTVTDASGASLKVRLVGDEFYHYYLTEDGYLLINRDGNFYYGNVDTDGTIAVSDIPATDIERRTEAARSYLQTVNMTAVASTLDKNALMSPRRLSMAKQRKVLRTSRKAVQSDEWEYGPGLFDEAQHYPSHGDQLGLIILVEYQDVKFTLPNPEDYFTRMCNEPNFNDYGGTGSAADYFIENSGGIFRPQFDVYGPVTLNRNMSYYGGNDSYGYDKNPEKMVIEACQQLDASVDFCQYDRDGDGYIDNVFVFYAGRGEASGGSPNTVWPHSWDISSATETVYTFDGVILDLYACSNEWEGERPDGVGTFIHEFSHVMGLPDLYPTDYTTSFTPGEWSAMDYGPYNNSGMTPPRYSAFERYALGWTKPIEITGAMNATLPDIGQNVVGIIRTSSPDEFFLFENRQQTSWDTYVPGHGMLVWHIDYNIDVWNDNVVNNTPGHQYVDLEEADNNRSDYTRAADAFPGTNNVRAFTDNTSPNMKSWSGEAMNLPVTEITETNGIIKFKVAGGRPPIGAVEIFEPENVTNTSFTAGWVYEEGKNYYFRLYTRPEEDADKAVAVEGYDNILLRSADHIDVAGLQPQTQYYYTVTLLDGLELAPVSEEMPVFTGIPAMNRRTAHAMQPTDISHNAFTANWEGMDDATDYQLTVISKEYGAPIVDTCGFDDGVNYLPAGWATTATNTYSMSTYCGSSAPSLRLSRNGDDITATYADGIRGISFWSRGSSTKQGDVINVYSTTADGTTLVAAVPISTTPGGATTELNDFPDSTTGVRLEFGRNSGSGSLAIDDVTVMHGITFTPVTVEGYEALSTGLTTSYLVTGLKAETEYFYTIRALDGDLISRSSAEMKVLTTATPTSIDSVTTASGIKVSSSAGVITVMSADLTITITDIAGRTVAAGQSELSAQLPAGIYFVHASNYKLKVKN